MNLSLLVLYCPPPTLDRAARFYGAILGVEPAREQHGVDGPVHWSVTSAESGLVVEVYTAVGRLHTSTRLKFRGSDVDAAVTRLMDTAFACRSARETGRAGGATTRSATRWCYWSSRAPRRPHAHAGAPSSP